MARILIIDDEEPIRFSLRGILEDEGYEVLEAATAEEGIEVADADVRISFSSTSGCPAWTASPRRRASRGTIPICPS